MTAKRPEPFGLALGELLARLRAGALRPDDRLAASDIAADLGLSATPVREALSRLAGEGLLEDRRGQGYFVRRLGGADIADLHRLSLAHLSIALDRGRPMRTAPPPWPGATSPVVDDANAVEAVERLFAAWVAAAGGRALAQAHQRVRTQLGPARRVESQVLGDLTSEAAALLVCRPEADRAACLARARAFHARRVRAAAAIAEALERGYVAGPL
jgi:DNA-binding transcriptional ArsR family regulator